MKAPGALLLSNKSPNKDKLGFEGFERTERGVRVGGGRPADWPPGLRCLRSTLPRLLRHPHTLHQPLLQTPVPGQASINQARIYTFDWSSIFSFPVVQCHLFGNFIPENYFDLMLQRANGKFANCL